jgi:membrane protease YdiL (CAAX protease family)
MAHTTQSGRTASVIARRPITSFLAIGLPLAFGLMSVPALAEYGVIPGKQAVARVGVDMEEAASVLLVFAVFTAALLVTWLSDGRDGVRILFNRMTRWRVGVRWYLVPVLALPAGSVAIAVLLGDQASAPSISTLLSEVASTAFALAVINIWEEGAWSGFLQTRLERRHSFFVACAITAVPFALVHVPVRVVTREITNLGELIGQFITLVILCLFARTLFATVLRGAANSVLLAAATHTMFNRSNNVDGIAADILSGPNQQVAALLTTAVLTIGLVIAYRRLLGRGVRRALDDAEARLLSSVTTRR